MKLPTIETILNVMAKKKYPVFISHAAFNFNLNLIGIRTNDTDTTRFNDYEAIIYQTTRGKWSLDWFDITTDPSNLLLTKPVNNLGTAILCEGHHSKLWSYGFHKGRRDHKALVQFSPCEVYRDNDKDTSIDKQLPIDTGMFGINQHRASAYGDNETIGLYSAGCQVHAHIDRYNGTFIPLIENCIREGNRIFSYTLLLENDLL